mmetsp:Transcript_11415/g.34449  ORF Transcript_11415/g.34449 Transcript_11415/m.34449 type:complete len:212 (-) Transcript_11415:1003-1638(-)
MHLSAQPSCPKYARMACTSASARARASGSVKYLIRGFRWPQSKRKSSPPHCDRRCASTETGSTGAGFDGLEAWDASVRLCLGETMRLGACRAWSRPEASAAAFPGEWAAAKDLLGEAMLVEVAETDLLIVGPGDSTATGRCGRHCVEVGCASGGSRRGLSSTADSLESSAGDPGGSLEAALRMIGCVLFGNELTILSKAAGSRCCESEAAA